MSAYEATATVEDHGDIRLTGLPFQPGTKVEVTVTPIHNGAGDARRTERLLAALGKARNSEPVGPLNRAELYDRDNLH